jgi:hypothetical protein
MKGIEQAVRKQEQRRAAGGSRRIMVPVGKPSVQENQYKHQAVLRHREGEHALLITDKFLKKN